MQLGSWLFPLYPGDSENNSRPLKTDLSVFVPAAYRAIGSWSEPWFLPLRKTSRQSFLDTVPQGSAQPGKGCRLLKAGVGMGNNTAPSLISGSSPSSPDPAVFPPRVSPRSPWKPLCDPHHTGWTLCVPAQTRRLTACSRSVLTPNRKGGHRKLVFK